MSSANSLRVAGLRLVVEGANAFQDAVNKTEQALKENRESLKMVDAQYGKYNDTAEKTAAKQKALTQQMELQKQKLETLRAAYAQYAAQENATQGNKDKLRLAIMRQETAVAGLNRTLQDNAIHLEIQQGAEAKAAQEKAAYSAAMGTVTNDLEMANQALSKNGLELQKLNALYGSASKDPQKLAEAQKLLTQQLDAQAQKLKALKKARKAYADTQGASQTRLRGMDEEIGREEVAQAGLERQLRETTDAIAAQERKAAEAQNRMAAWGDSAVKAGKKLSQAGGKIARVLTTTTAAGFTYAAKEAVDFEDAYAGVVKTVNASDAELAQLRKGIIGLSGSGLVTQSKEEVAEVAAIAGQLAIATPNILGFSQAMLQMADATNLTSETAATELAQFANITGMSQDKFENLGSAIVALGNSTATQEDKIVSMGMRIAAAGRQSRMSEASIMGISAALASVGVEAEAGGTAISKVLLNMDMAAAKGERALSGYAKVAGMSAKEYKNLWNTSSEQAFTAFIEGLGRIDAEGGNVALTLEKLGYTEVRTRDALMRSALAGDLMGSAIATANQAYAENTALAEESAKKNSTFAARLKILKNQADNAAMGLGEALMPTLENALGTVSGLVAGFADLDEGQKQTVLGFGAVALGIGPAIKGIGLMSQGAGYAAKAFGLFRTALSGPAGWIGLATAGILGLGAALAAIKSPLERLENQLKNVTFDVDGEIAAAIEKGTNAGIEAANKEYAISLAVTTEMDGLGKSVASALEGGKITKKEYNSLREQLNTMVKTEIDNAQKDLAESVTTYRATLDGLKTVTGEDLFTPEEKEKIIADITDKTTTLITELETYQTEYGTLLKTLYAQKEPVTAQQMAELDALMLKITGVRKEIREATDEALMAMRAQYELTTSGKGTDEGAGQAVAYVSQTLKNNQGDAEAAYQKQMAADGALLGQMEKDSEEYNTLTSAMETRAKEHAENMAGYTQEANRQFALILQGEARRAGVENDLAWLSQVADRLGLAKEALASLDGQGSMSLSDVINSVIGPGGSLNSSMTEAELTKAQDLVTRYNKIKETLDAGKELSAAESSELFGIKNEVNKILSRMITDLTTNELDISGSDKMDFMTTLFQSMFDAGAFQPEDIDLTGVDGALEGVLNLIDATGKGAQFGYDFSGGIGPAMLEKASEVQTAGNTLVSNAETGLAGMGTSGASGGKSLVDGMVASLYAGGLRAFSAAAWLGGRAAAGLNSKNGIYAGSPSRKSRQSGKWFVEGFAGEIDSMAELARRAGERLGGASVDSLSQSLERLTSGTYRPNVAFDAPIAGNERAMAEFFGGGNGAGRIQEISRSEDNSVNVNVQDMHVNNVSDARALGVEIGNIRRRQLAGLGTI